MGSIHKYDMGVIGNCSFLAYISKTAEIKWMCLPRFDSSFVFGSLLDQEKGGEFYIRPVENDFYTFQSYLKKHKYSLN
ncbi:MAG: trehalase-like domain-containing protein [Bacteroidales bacterium]